MERSIDRASACFLKNIVRRVLVAWWAGFAAYACHEHRIAKSALICLYWARKRPLDRSLWTVRMRCVTFTLRKATESDAAGACETVRRSIIDLCEQDHHCEAATLEEWLGNKTEVNFQSWINSDRHVAIVAEHLAAIIGFALLSRNEGRLLLLYVSPDARFQGVSRAMLAALESEPSKAGIRKIVLDSTATAKRFYMACGYGAHRRTIASFWCCSGLPDGKENSDMNERMRLK